MRSLPPKLLLALVPVLVAAPATSTSVRAAPKLTCTFIHKQCLTECTPRATPGFCKFHCDGEKRSCLATGTWNSFGREFRNVTRR